MAQFSAKKIDTNTINGGQQVVKGSGVTPELFNAPVESALYTEKAIEVLTSNADVSQANAVGTPTVSFVSKTEGGVEYKYLKFANLKGETGKTGRTGPEGPVGKIGPVGPKGETGAAAGFGTPTISVETLGEGSYATATVRASGDNTAKVFAFNLGIPKGDTGRGIKTVVSDGNDLIIKYDDGSEKRLQGVIQINNSLVADNKTDFDAALIEENIGKTISYKDNLYLIVGRGRTKLVNNGVTDYNALYNRPVIEVATKEELDSYGTEANEGQLLSYGGNLFSVQREEPEKIAVGDGFSKIYFDTESTPDLSTILTNVVNPSETKTLIDGNYWALKAERGYNSTTGENYYYLFVSVIDAGTKNYLVYYQNYTYGDLVNGWDTSVLDELGGIAVATEYDGSPYPVLSVTDSNIWDSYVAKTPFNYFRPHQISWGVASANNSGIITTEAQEIAGTKTFKDGINSDTINVSNFYVNLKDGSRVTMSSSNDIGAAPTIYFRPNSEKAVGFRLINYYSGIKCTFDLSLGKDGTVGIGINDSYITLPETTSADAGKFLKVGADGGWVAEHISNGVTDVQVNGTSIVSDGVASIPDAGSNTSGLLSAGQQNIGGQKTFVNDITIGDSSKNTITISPAAKSQGYSLISVKFSDGTTSNFRLDKNDADPYGSKVSYSGIMATQGWTEGTSGNTSLLNYGLYEIKALIDDSYFCAIINWDGNSSSASLGCSTYDNGTKFTQYWVSASTTGLLTITMANENGISSMSGSTIKFRRIGKQ